MKRHEKIHKLANAIKEYRGRYNEKTGKWIQPPKPSVKARVILGFERLGINKEPAMKAVDGFKNFNEFHKWISAI